MNTFKKPQVLILMCSMFCLFTSCKKNKPNSQGDFFIKGILIDSCDGKPLNKKIDLSLYAYNTPPITEINSYRVGFTSTNISGQFTMRCGLYKWDKYYICNPYAKEYYLLNIQPKVGDTIDLGKIAAGYKAYLNVKFSFASINPTDTLFMGNNAKDPIMSIYPIPATNVVYYGYETYFITHIAPTTKQNTWYWGIGKVAYSNAIATQTNKINAKEVPCTPIDTFFVNIP